MTRRFPLLLTILLMFSLGGSLHAQAGFPPPTEVQTAPAPPSPHTTTAESSITNSNDGELGEAAPAVHDLKALKEKTLIFVFDVSGSMKGANMSRAREATINILREATNVGDRVVLFTFGAGTEKVFDQKIAIEADKAALINKVPFAPQEGAGTNIRKPHHEALKILDAEQQKPGAIILLTDSFNDQPKPTDAAFAEYKKYYIPGDRLTKYPDTPENRDYERLLAKLSRTRKVKAYGIGVQIDEAGRPEERLPQAAPEATAAPTEPAVDPTPAKKDDISLWVWGLLGALVLGGLIAGLLLSGNKPIVVRITGVPGGAKDFTIKGSQGFTLGGGAGFGADVLAIPGVKEPLAMVTSKSGEMRLVPGNGKTPPAPAPAGNQTGGLRVYHNGVALEKEAALRFGDEVRVTVPDETTGVPKDFRLRFEDPKQAFTKRY